MTIHLVWKAKIALLLAKKFTVSVEYIDFANVFLRKSAKILPKYTKINKYTIMLEKDKQLM